MAMQLGSGDFGNLLKVIYEPGIKNQLMEEVPLLTAFKEAGADEVKIGGYMASSGVQVSGFKWAVQLQMSGGVLHTGESTSATTGNIAPAGIFATQQAGAPECQCYGRVEWTNAEIQASKRDAAAFAEATKFKMDALVVETERVANGALWNKKPMRYDAAATSGFTDLFSDTGNPVESGTTLYPTGVLGQVVAAADVTSGSTFVLDFVVSPQHFWPGRKILLATEAEFEGGTADTAGTYRTVTDVSVNAAGTQTTVTVSAAFANSAGNIASNDDFVVAGAPLGAAAANGDPNEFNLAPFGIPYLAIHPKATFNDALYGISNVTYPQWLPKASMYNVGALTRTRVNAWLRNYKQVCGKHAAVIFGHGSAVDAMQETLDPDVRYEPVEFIGGYNRDTFVWQSGTTKVPVRDDPYAPLGDIFAWNYDDVKIGYLQPWEWVADPDGGRFLRQADKVTWQAVFGALWQLVGFSRRGIAAMTGIDVDYSSVAFGA